MSSSQVISLRLNEKEQKQFKDFADYQGISLSELFKKSAREAIEDAMDYEIAVASYKEYQKDPVLFSPEEVLKALDE